MLAASRNINASVAPIPMPELIVDAVTLPDASTLNLLAVATCKSINNEAAALAVFVTFALIAVNVTPLAFHVCVRLISGVLVVTVAPSHDKDPAIVCAAFHSSVPTGDVPSSGTTTTVL